MRCASDDCAGAVDVQRDRRRRRAAAPRIDAFDDRVPAAHWTHDTAHAITLGVTEGNLAVMGDTVAWFDRVSLIVHGDDTIFADGFEQR